MAWPVLVLIQIAIGALIGGLTNELAIRMLFRPYKPVYIGKWRVPFTPGLIPKRHEELAYQMGKLVENFLITPQGIKNMLKKDEVEEEIQRWLFTKMDQMERSEETFEAILRKWGFSLDERIEEQLKKGIKLFLEKKWSQASYSTIEELLPVGIKEVLENKAEEAAPYILEKMSQYLSSEEGNHMVRQMLNQLTSGLGMLGGLAGMLLSDEKVIHKVTASLESALAGPDLKAKVAGILRNECRILLKKQVGEVIHWMGEEKIEQSINLLIDKVVDLQYIRQIKWGAFWAPILPALRDSVPDLVRSLLNWVETNLEEGLKKINLTKIAATQVEGFPVHKLEEMIVSITGKELKMITVFGALLGGVIGAVQAFIVLVLQ